MSRAKQKDELVEAYIDLFLAAFTDATLDEMIELCLALRTTHHVKRFCACLAEVVKTELSVAARRDDLETRFLEIVRASWTFSTMREFRLTRYPKTLPLADICQAACEVCKMRRLVDDRARQHERGATKTAHSRIERWRRRLSLPTRLDKRSLDWLQPVNRDERTLSHETRMYENPVIGLRVCEHCMESNQDFVDERETSAVSDLVACLPILCSAYFGSLATSQ